MHKKDLISLSKYLSLILRHKPETVGIELDNNGWANVDKLIKKVRECAGGRKKASVLCNRENIEEVVITNDKQRFEFNDDKTKIRARQGHSIDVDVELEEKTPPVFLYHGTSDGFIEAIKREGLKPQGRKYVHLSEDRDVAEKVGRRHGGKTVILRVKAEEYQIDKGAKFYLSRNGVWLTDQVPYEYLEFSFLYVSS